MRTRILASLVALLLGLSACGSGPQSASRSGGGAGGVEEVKEALAALRRARTGTFSAVQAHRFVDSGEPREVREVYEGAYQGAAGPWGDALHVTMNYVSDQGPPLSLRWWDLGPVTVAPNSGTDRDPDAPPPLPWRADPEPPVDGHPLLPVMLDLIGLASEARAEGSERRDGVELTRWTVTVPGEAATDLFGYGRHRGMAIDCTAGLPVTVWVDREGRLRRVRLVTEAYDLDTFDTEFAFGDLGRPVGDDVAPPTQDQIEGSIDPRARAAAEHAAEEQLARVSDALPTPAPTRGHRPASTAAGAHRRRSTGSR